MRIVNKDIVCLGKHNSRCSKLRSRLKCLKLTVAGVIFNVLFCSPGKLVMVVGTVGSGKSSLVSAMLGEMLTTAGKVTWPRGSSIAYVSQKPWLLNKTIKDNILFGSNYSWRRFVIQRFIHSLLCCMLQKLDVLGSCFTRL